MKHGDVGLKPHLRSKAPKIPVGLKPDLRPTVGRTSVRPTPIPGDNY